MKVCTGDEPVVIDGGGVPMPIDGIMSCGLRLFDDGRMKGAMLVREEGDAVDSDHSVFVLSFPDMLQSGFWHSAFAGAGEHAG